jgi:hypothetical protein
MAPTAHRQVSFPRFIVKQGFVGEIWRNFISMPIMVRKDQNNLVFNVKNGLFGIN